MRCASSALANFPTLLSGLSARAATGGILKIRAGAEPGTQVGGLFDTDPLNEGPAQQSNGRNEDHRMTDEDRFSPIYRLLRARGHSPAKAAEILIDVKRKDAHARQWTKVLRASCESRALPLESWLTEASL